MGTLLHSCAEVRAAIELSFGFVSGVTPGIHVLYGVHVPQGEGWILGSFTPIGPMVSMAYFCNNLSGGCSVHEKLMGDCYSRPIPDKKLSKCVCRIVVVRHISYILLGKLSGNSMFAQVVLRLR